MKNALVLSLVCLGVPAWTAHAQAPAPAANANQTAPASVASDASLVHVVLFKLNEGETPEAARALADDSRRLLKAIPGVESVWAGPKAVADRDVHVKDYDVALCVRLRTVADLKAYATHPQHRELVEKWKARATWRVVDFADR